MSQWKKLLVGILTATLIILSGAACAALFMGGSGMPGPGYAETLESREEGETARKTEAAGETEVAGETEAAKKTKAGEEAKMPKEAKTAKKTKAAEKVGAKEEREGPPVRIILETEAVRENMEEEARKAKEKEDCILLFAGDVYLSDHVLNAYDKAGGIHGVLDEGIREEIAASDIFMVNQEFPFTERGTAAADKQFTFRLPPERMQVMNDMGIDIVTLANNHILDFGPEGLLDSMDALDEAANLPMSEVYLAIP